MAALPALVPLRAAKGESSHFLQDEDTDGDAEIQQPFLHSPARRLSVKSVHESEGASKVAALRPRCLSLAAVGLVLLAGVFGLITVHNLMVLVIIPTDTVPVNVTDDGGNATDDAVDSAHTVTDLANVTEHAKTNEAGEFTDHMATDAEEEKLKVAQVASDEDEVEATEEVRTTQKAETTDKVSTTTKAETTTTTAASTTSEISGSKRGELKTGWRAFEVDSNGAGIPAADPTSLTSGGRVAYQQLPLGTMACPPGLDIATVEECRSAATALGILVNTTWQGSVPDAPRYCSVTVKPSQSLAVVNLNSAPSGQGRGDIIPLCLTVPRPSYCPACVSSKRIIPAVVIPFFERDLCKFGYTARSIAVHDSRHLLGDLYIMWVSYISAWSHMDEIQRIIAEVNKSRPVHFYDLSDMVKKASMPGWISQQVLKLKIASVVQDDYYMVLDSKNTLIKDLERDTLVTKCNQAIAFSAYTALNMPEPHKGWYYSTASQLGLKWPTEGRWPDSISPMIMKTQTVLSMLRSIGEDPDFHSLCKGPLCGWMKDQSATEFILYQLYAHFRTDFQCSHGIDWPIVGSMWRGRTSASSIDYESRQIFYGAQSGAFRGIWGNERIQAGWKLIEVFRNAGLIVDPNPSPDGMLNCIG
jgi:hypothetical protein